MAHIFQMQAPYQPAGDQVEAIPELIQGFDDGLAFQTLLGVTGSGKTYTMAKVIEGLQRPAIILAHNKTLAAQLYAEMKAFFPKNAVEYFVSYYDYYQPEAYVPSRDLYIEKDASINAQIEQMRLSATKSILERRDTIIVATVSAIYGLGDPQTYMKMLLHVRRDEVVPMEDVIQTLMRLQYTRNDVELDRGMYRVRGEMVEVFPADSDKLAYRLRWDETTLESLQAFDPLTRRVERTLERLTIYPTTHYVTPRETILQAIDTIKEELKVRLQELHAASKLVEAQRLEQRTRYDLEMLLELGFCSGIENYSRHLTQSRPGDPPPTLLSYLPTDALMMIDESHVTVGQLGAMYKGDRARKTNLVEYGFRLPSAMDNRPLKFEEFENIAFQTLYVSATPGTYELERSAQIVEQIVRPTGLLDPKLEVRSAQTQVDDVLGEIRSSVAKGHRVLITTLTKKMSEDLTDFLSSEGVRVRYLHSDIDTVERVEIIRDLRQGVFDVLVGINLLREGLDMPEVALVAILDADKEGFLRSTRSLIQTIGRAARHVEGRAILYAEKITPSMKAAIEETERRYHKQEAYNQQHGITPRSTVRALEASLEQSQDAATEEVALEALTPAQLAKRIREYEKQMRTLAQELRFEEAAALRDTLHQLKARVFIS